MKAPQFQIGDVVEAITEILRVDGKTTLYPGERASVMRIWTNPKSKSQIIDLEVPDKLPLCDIVCFANDYPVKLVRRGENND